MNFSFAVLHCLADGGGDVDADAEENRIQVVHDAARIARVELEVRRDRNLAAQDDAMIVSLGGRQNAPDHGLPARWRSEEHTSELQSRLHLVCRLLLEKKKNH